MTNEEKILDQLQLLNKTFSTLLEQLENGIEPEEGERIAQILTPFAEHNQKLIDSLISDNNRS